MSVRVRLPAPRGRKAYFATTSFYARSKKTLSARFLAPPFQLRPVSLGSQLVFVLQLRVSFLSTLPTTGQASHRLP